MTTQGPAPRWVAVGAPLLVGLITMATFAPVLGAGFVNWDDPENFLRNPAYRGLGPAQLRWMLSAFHMGHYIPLAWVTLGLDYLAWGMDPRGYHATNLAFHAATALAVYFLGLRLLRLGLGGRAGEGDLRVGALLAALLFAVHPLRAESVAWITERRDVLSGLLGALCLIAYLRSVEADPPRGRWYWAALLLFLGALLAKVITAMLAPLLLVLDVYPLRRLGGQQGWRPPRVWLEKLPFLALGVALSVVAFAAVASQAHLRSVAEMSLPFRIVLAVGSTAFYLKKAALPVGLSPLYQFPVTVTWAHFGLVAGGMVLAVAARRRWPAFTAVWVAYLVLLFPVSGLLHNGPQAAADRYTYLPGIAWALLAGVVVTRPGRARAVLRVVAACAVVVLAVLAFQQAATWHDGVSLWRHAVAVNPASRAAHAKLGEAYAQAGRLPEAIAHYEETLRRSVNPAPYHAIIGGLLVRAGQPARALERFTEALRLTPGLPEACAGLSELARQLSVPESSDQSCREPPLRQGRAASGSPARGSAPGA